MNEKKIALIGKGKTGGKVIELCQSKNMPYDVFDSKTNFATINWAQYHAGIIFIPGPQILQLLPFLLKSQISWIIGSTGFSFPQSMDEQVKKQGTCWIHGRNFALGMQLIHHMLEFLGQGQNIFEQKKAAIHEVHHTKKLDSPSGTAVAWAEWFGNPSLPITSERLGDIIGDHSFTLESHYERITLRHEALDRKIFAEGALWALKLLREHKGLHNFEEIVKNKFKEKILTF